MPKPDVTHYFGRKVVRVHEAKGPPVNSKSDWIIELEGGVLLKNRDGRKTTTPSEKIVGSTLLSCNADDKGTTLVFGQVVIPPGQPDNPQIQVAGELVFGKNKMRITDATMDDGDYDPDDKTEADDLPPDPSADRVVDGPVKPPKPLKGSKA